MADSGVTRKTAPVFWFAISVFGMTADEERVEGPSPSPPVAEHAIRSEAASIMPLSRKERSKILPPLNKIDNLRARIVNRTVQRR